MARRKTPKDFGARFVASSSVYDPAAMRTALGPLRLLPGKWVSKGNGWNMIALPFQKDPTGFKFRVLMNQYDEELVFTTVDNNVPNRGLLHPGSGPDFDQFVATLDYEQKIKQIIAEDQPPSTLAGGPGLDIHHEPGLWLYMKNLKTEGINIARLASIPHGNALTALGTYTRNKNGPDIPQINGLPIGRFEDLRSGGYDFEADPYLAPYKHYIHHPFMGNVTSPLFPGFNPADMNEILRFANKGVKFLRTTTLTVDTKLQDAGIVNIPFVVREAHPVSMRSTFWIQVLKKKDPRTGKRKLRMQYSQVVILNFFKPREDQLPGRAQWPHISINTLEKVL